MSAYTDAVERGLEGMEAVSFGLIAECPECNPEGLTDEALNYAGDEGGFSWSSCGICGSSLDGNHYVWHWLDENKELRHEDDGCVDCLMYVSNGDEPVEEWNG